MGCCVSREKVPIVDFDEWAISSEHLQQKDGHSAREGECASQPVAQTVDLLSFLYLNNDSRASRKLKDRVGLIDQLQGDSM